MKTVPVRADRPSRDIEYHRQLASRRSRLNYRPVATDIIARSRRRPWNPYWSMWDRVLAANVAGKRILVPGCGFGEDAIRLALLGAEVYGCDVSPEAIDI